MEVLWGSVNVTAEVAATEPGAVDAAHRPAASTVEQKVEAAEAAGADFAESQQPAAATASEKRRMEPPQPLQVAKRRSLPAAAGTAGLAAAQPQQPVVPVMLRAAPVRADRSNEALRTPRSKPMPPGTDTFWWKPARINADSAAAEPNGIVDACDLQRGKFTVVIYTVVIWQEAEDL